MPYGNTAAFVRTYQFGSTHQRHPLPGETEAIAEMRRCLDLWNAYVELERDTLTDRDADLDAAAPGWRDLEGVERKALWKRPDIKAILDRHEQDRTATARDLLYTPMPRPRPEITDPRPPAVLYWGNSNAVRLAYEQARKRPGDLRFHAWARSAGRLTVQIQGGLPVADLFAGRSNQIQIDGVDQDGLTSPVRAVRRRAGRGTLRFRIRSDAARAPVWLELPIVVHRPLPPDGIVKQASVLRERVGEQVRWSLVLAVAEPEPQATSRVDIVGIDVGWRQTEHGIRVAVWHDGRQSGEVTLPANWQRQMDQVEEVQGVRARHFDAVRPALAAWLAEAPDVPDWLREATETLSQWRSEARLAGVVKRWRGHRFHGDEAGYALAEVWRKRDKHLGEWVSHHRDQLIRQRREVYRVAAHDLVTRAGVIALEQFDLRRVARVKQRPQDAAPPDGADLPAPVRAARTRAAISVFRLALKSAARHAGVEVRTVRSRLTTQVCPDCAHRNQDTDFGASVTYQCQGCGRVQDQDVAAARLIRFLAMREP